MPRGGSEIDEILGSSKTKPPSRLFPAMIGGNSQQPLAATATKPVHRQSRVELYENDRKRLKQNNKFSSIRKLFKGLGSNPNLLSVAEIGSSGSQAGGASGSSPQLVAGSAASGATGAASADRRNSISSSNNIEVKFMDKEHEREIVEREKIKSRPEIIHPLDLQSGGVEVVKITPKSQSQALYEKNKQAKHHAVLQTKSILVNKGGQQNNKIDNSVVNGDIFKNQDSGHETSSIHTENSDQGSNEISVMTSSASSDTSSSSHQHQVGPRTY